MNDLLALMGIILAVAFLIFLIRIPIIIAKSRKITGSDLQTVAVLSWCSLLLGITWFIALILAFVYTPKRENETKSISKISLEQKINELEKLADLKEKGIISDSEFEAEKQKLMQ